MPGMRELFQGKLAALKFTDDLLDFAIRRVRPIGHAATSFGQKKSPARKLRTGGAFFEISD
jgi:hypothetical protein